MTDRPMYRCGGGGANIAAKQFGGGNAGEWTSFTDLKPGNRYLLQITNAWIYDYNGIANVKVISSGSMNGVYVQTFLVTASASTINVMCNAVYGAALYEIGNCQLPAQNKITISFNPNLTGAVAPEPQIINLGERAAEPAITWTQQHYTPVGWDFDFNQRLWFSQTVNLKWTPKVYKVTIKGLTTTKGTGGTYDPIVTVPLGDQVQNVAYGNVASLGNYKVRLRVVSGTADLINGDIVTSGDGVYAPITTKQCHSGVRPYSDCVVEVY